MSWVGTEIAGCGGRDKRLRRRLALLLERLSDKPTASIPAACRSWAEAQAAYREAVPFTIRLKLPANYEIPAHWHPAIEHVTVTSGTLHMGMGDKLDRAKTKALPMGSVAIMQPKTHHFAWTGEETIIQVHGVGPWAINYVDPADDPRKR